MADGCSRPAAEVRHTFLVQAHAEIDVLVRVLGPFTVQGARIVAADLTEREGQVAIRIEVMGMPAGRAEHLTARLRALPAVLAVGLGWRSETPLLEGVG
jgi:hypothetical protein